jgi:two-component system copper resistance phosphate regulon response regulator CusR
MRILVIEDELKTAAYLKKGLEESGYAVDVANDGPQGLILAQEEEYDVIVLDVMLPGMDGWTVVKTLRSTRTTPVLFLTARDDVDDRVRGLELGADDYLVKPFGFRELVARIRAVLRRSGEPPPADQVQVLGALTVDRRSRRVLVDGAEVLLSPKEFDLLALLAEDPGAVVNRHTILEEVWDPHWYGPTKTVDVHVASLRRKLGHPEWIETVRRVGLRLGQTT